MLAKPVCKLNVSARSYLIPPMRCDDVVESSKFSSDSVGGGLRTSFISYRTQPIISLHCKPPMHRQFLLLINESAYYVCVCFAKYIVELILSLRIDS